MSNQLTTIAIILSLGTAGCAGLGVQQASSLGPMHDEQGLDALWMPAEHAPAKGAQSPSLGGEALGTLWQSEGRTPPAASDGVYYGQRTRADLWNPASVAGGSVAVPSRSAARKESLLFSEVTRGPRGRFRAAQ